MQYQMKLENLAIVVEDAESYVNDLEAGSEDGTLDESEFNYGLDERKAAIQNIREFIMKLEGMSDVTDPDA